MRIPSSEHAWVLPGRPWDTGPSGLAEPHWCNSRRLVHMGCVSGFLASLGFDYGCVSGCRYRGAGHSRVYMCVCARVDTTNQAVTRASFGPIMHTGRRAVRMGACFLAPHTITGCIWRKTGTDRQGLTRRPSGPKPAGRAASLGEFGSLETPLLVHDPGGPAWIQHASTDLRDIFVEPDMKGDKGGWSWRPKT